MYDEIHKNNSRGEHTQGPEEEHSTRTWWFLHSLDIMDRAELGGSIIDDVVLGQFSSTVYSRDSLCNLPTVLSVES